MTFFSKTFSNIKGMLAVAGIPFCLFVLFCLSFVFYPSELTPKGADDYMRLLRVQEFLNGQGWYDFFIERLGSHGTNLNWARAGDLPLYFIARFFGLFTLPMNALSLAAFSVPLVILALVLCQVFYLSRVFVGRSYAFWGCSYLLSLGTIFLYQFKPLRVDHHALFLLLSAVVFTSLCLSFLRRRALCPSLFAAFFSSLLLWLGGESYPFLICCGVALGFLSVAFGGLLQRRAALYGLFLGLFTALLLPVARPMSAWSDHSVLWFSSASVAFALLMGTVFVFFDKLSFSYRSRLFRFILFAALSFLMAGLFFSLIPEAERGVSSGFGGYSAKLVMGHASETLPLWDVLRSATKRPFSLWFLLLPFFLPLFSLIAALSSVYFRNVSLRRQILISLASFFMLAFLVLSLFWQRRFLPYVLLFSAPLVAWAFARIEDRFPTQRLRYFLLLLLFVPPVLLPWALRGQAFYPNLVLFYATPPQKRCDPVSASRFLGDPNGYGAYPSVLANVVSDGPALLYFTPHRILSAPYDVESNEAMFYFFSDKLGQLSHEIAVERKIDFVLVCQYVSKAYVPDFERRGDQDLTLIERLALRRPPDWLREVPLPHSPSYRLYETIR